jgi:hypothetical protein
MKKPIDKYRSKEIIYSFVYISTLIFLTTACCDRPYETGHFPDNPINFIEINSEYDDMNCAESFINDKVVFVFSSSRNSKGGDLDIVKSPVEINWDMKDGKLSISKYSDNVKNITDTLLQLINTKSNEYGPNFISYDKSGSQSIINREVILYSSDVSGNSDIMLAYVDKYSGLSMFKGPEALNITKTDKDELYPSFYGENWKIFDYNSKSRLNIESISEMYFCANYDGNFNIYKIAINKGSDFVDSIIARQYIKPEKVESVCTTADDKCPFVNGNLMVFTSNRSGGFGGYDLYYSKREGKTWTVPENFGEKINSANDEYRPYIIRLSGYDNNLMIFSSNRPGGKGGYDLYYVGIDKIIE